MPCKLWKRYNIHVASRFSDIGINKQEISLWKKSVITANPRENKMLQTRVSIQGTISFYIQNVPYFTTTQFFSLPLSLFTHQVTDQLQQNSCRLRRRTQDTIEKISTDTNWHNIILRIWTATNMVSFWTEVSWVAEQGYLFSSFWRNVPPSSSAVKISMVRTPLPSHSCLLLKLYN